MWRLSFKCFFFLPSASNRNQLWLKTTARPKFPAGTPGKSIPECPVNPSAPETALTHHPVTMWGGGGAAAALEMHPPPPPLPPSPPPSSPWIRGRSRSREIFPGFPLSVTFPPNAESAFQCLPVILHALLVCCARYFLLSCPHSWTEAWWKMWNGSGDFPTEVKWWVGGFSWAGAMYNISTVYDKY